MTINQLRQVLRAYTSQWALWVLAGLLTLLHLLVSASGSPSSEERAGELLPEIALNIVMPNAILGWTIGGMLAMQFGNGRIRLLPGFAAAHLAVPAGIVAAAIAVQTAILPARLGMDGRLAVGCLAFVIVAVTVWAVLAPGRIGTCVVFGTIAVYFFAAQYLEAFFTVLIDNPVLPAGFAVAAIVLLVVLARRLVVPGKDLPEYSGAGPFGTWNDEDEECCSATDSPAQGRTRSPFRDLGLRLILAKGGAPGPWRRMLLRQCAGGFCGAVTGTGMVILMAVCSFLLVKAGSMEEPGRLSVFYVSALPTLVAIVVLATWKKRWPHIATESFRPLDRYPFAREMARSVTFDLAIPAGVNCAIVVVYLALFVPTDALPENLTTWLALAAAQYVVWGCAIFWLVSCRPILVAFPFLMVPVVIFGLWPISAATALLADPGFWSPLKAVFAVVWTVLVSACFYQMGIQRWCRVDLA